MFGHGLSMQLSQSPPRLLLVVAAALLDPHGRVLLTRRPEGKAHAGLWEFPGGKVEPHESPEQALVRELREEIAVEVAEDALEPFAFASRPAGERSLLMPLYLVRDWSGQPKPLQTPELAWVRPADLPRFPMPPADVPLAERLADKDWT